jgi:hypothetical protein
VIPKTARLITWTGPIPELGDLLETAAGSAYLVLRVRENTRPDRKSVAFLHLGKLDPDEREELPSTTRRHSFAWAARERGKSVELAIHQ